MRHTTALLTLSLLLAGSAGLAAQAPDSTAVPDSLRNTTADSLGDRGERKGDGSRRAGREGRAGREREGARGARRGGSDGLGRRHGGEDAGRHRRPRGTERPQGGGNRPHGDGDRPPRP